MVVEGEDLKRTSIILHGNYFKGALFQFPWSMQGSSLRRGREVTSTGGAEAVSSVKKISSKLRAQRPQLPQCLPTCTHIPHIPASRKPFLTNQYTQLNSRHTDKMGVQVTFCISHMQDEIMSLIFSNLNRADTEDKGFLQSTHRSLRAFNTAHKLELKFLNSTVSFSTLFSYIKSI